MKFILAKKLEMTQVYRPDGAVVPVTLVQAGPCVVTQVKTSEKDGVDAVQIGFLPAKKLNKPKAGHVKDISLFTELCDFRVENTTELKRGDSIEATVFEPGDVIHVSGVSKGKGFQGVVKRHGFHGHPTSHGHKDQVRMPGSSGAGGPQHVLKGRRMAGRMGNARVTVQKLQIVEVREGGILAIKGAVPGARNAVLEIVSA